MLEKFTQSLKEDFEEQTVIFISIFKWFILASITGAIVGLSTTVFLKILNWSTSASAHFNYFFLFMPAAFFLSTLLTKYLPMRKATGPKK
jgi:H+/Cl- antiporter ClcA